MPATANIRHYNLKTPPAVGDLIRIRGIRGPMIVVEAGPVQDHDSMRGDSYYGYYFSTLRAPCEDGFWMDRYSVMNPKPKQFFLEGMSMGGPGTGVELSAIDKFGTAKVKKLVQIQYEYGVSKTVKML
jgi:hypothetical protein